MADEAKKEETTKEELKAEAQPVPEVKEKTVEELLKEKDDKIAEMTDKYLRALAEQDNYRKRVQKDKEDFVKYSKSESISVFLPVVDNFERAVASADKTKDYGQLKKGIEMVLKQFEGVLKELGAKEVPTKGVFDPAFHHVMHKEHVEGKKEGEIIEVYQRGYMIDDKLVRPAMVKIAHNADDKNKNHHEKKQ